MLITEAWQNNTLISHHRLVGGWGGGEQEGGAGFLMYTDLVLLTFSCMFLSSKTVTGQGLCRSVNC